MGSPGISSLASTDLIVTLFFVKGFSCGGFPSALPLLLWHHQPSAGDLLLMEIASGTYTPCGHNLTAYQPVSQYVKSGDVKILYFSFGVPFPLQGIANLTWCIVANPTSVYISSAALSRLWTLCGTFLLRRSSLGIIFLLDIFFMGVISLGSALQAAVISRSGSFLSYSNFHGVDRK